MPRPRRVEYSQHGQSDLCQRNRLRSDHTVPGWAVSDIHATARDLAAKGVTFNICPGFGQDDLRIWASPDGKVKNIWFNDPERNGPSLTEA